MENLLSKNVRRICKEQKIQLKELAAKKEIFYDKSVLIEIFFQLFYKNIEEKK